MFFALFVEEAFHLIRGRSWKEGKATDPRRVSKSERLRPKDFRKDDQELNQLVVRISWPASRTSLVRSTPSSHKRPESVLRYSWSQHCHSSARRSE